METRGMSGIVVVIAAITVVGLAIGYVVTVTNVGTDTALAPERTTATKEDSRTQLTPETTKEEPKISGETTGVLGDVDGNGELTVADAVYLLQAVDTTYASLTISDLPAYERDVNQDGTTDVYDGVALLELMQDLESSLIRRNQLIDEVPTEYTGIQLGPGGLGTLASVCTGPAATFIRGDVDLSGTRNIGDAIFILNTLFVPPFDAYAAECVDAGDTNNDNTVNIADAITLLLHLFPISGQPPLTIAPTYNSDFTSTAEISPGVDEMCNSLDDDADGLFDEGCIGGTFETTYGSIADDFGLAVASTADGGYVVLTRGSQQLFRLVKFSGAGVFEWESVPSSAVSFGSIIVGYFSGGVAQLSDGGYVATVIDQSQTPDALLILKFDSTGQIIEWEQQVGSTIGFETIHDLILLSNGDIVVTGFMSSVTNENFFVAKVSVDPVTNQPQIDWENEYDITPGEDDLTISLREASNGDILVTGVTSDVGTSAYYPAWIRINAASGVAQPSVQYNSDDFLALDILQLPGVNGDVVVLGYDESPDGLELIAWDASGNFLWSETYSLPEEYIGLEFDYDGEDFILFGFSEATSPERAIIMKIDGATRALEWVEEYHPTSGSVYDSIFMGGFVDAGKYVGVGTAVECTTTCGGEVYLVKTDINGQI